jgi:hypothetical protein
LFSFSALAVVGSCRSWRITKAEASRAASIDENNITVSMERICELGYENTEKLAICCQLRQFGGVFTYQRVWNGFKSDIFTIKPDTSVKAAMTIKILSHKSILWQNVQYFLPDSIECRDQWP